MKSFAIALLVACCGLAQQAPRTVVVGTERLARAPLDKNIYGALLEHIGQQMDVMWAELLQDNSFEGLREFSEHSVQWAEGKIDSSRFWWHSGYELHPWRSFGTDQTASVSTSFGTNIMNGIHAKVIANRGEHPAGIAQDGIPVRAGMTYRFQGYLRPTGRGGETKVTVGLYADTGLQKPYATATIAVTTPGFQKYSAALKVPTTNQNATFALAVQPKGFAAVDLVSLMPADNVSGWRADVIAALKDMGLTSFRYPGGCFASFVDWETMVGPPEQRVPFTNPFWGGLEPNHVGTDEFLRLMELVQGEPLLDINMISGTPERAAAWVEYCNGSERTHYGKMRARNGHPKPYGVKHWELDNEVARRFSVAQYADQCRRYSDAMRAVDPTIKLAAVGYFWTDDDLRLLVERAGPVIDYLAIRTVDKGDLAKLQALADRYSTPRHRLLIAATEWRNRFRKDAWFPNKLDGSMRKFESSWGHALECARTFQEYQRHSDLVRMAMFPTVSNLYGEDLMNIGKADITYATNGQVFKLMSGICGQAVRTEVQGTGKFDVNAVLDEPARRLVCTLVNGDPQQAPVQLDLRAWPRISPRGQAFVLSSERLENRSNVNETQSTVTGKAGVFAMTLPPYSVSKVNFVLE